MDHSVYAILLHYKVPVFHANPGWNDSWIHRNGSCKAFGCIFYFFLKHTADYVALSSSSAEGDLIEGYKYIFQHLVQDKTLLLTIIVFAVVIVLTYIIYRMSFAYSWYVAIITGGVVEIILFLVGTLSMEVEVSLAGALLGCILAILVTIVVQFFKIVVDYSSVENTQFEDDDYYYYVKAVPKVMGGAQRKAPEESDHRQDHSRRGRLRPDQAHREAGQRQRKILLQDQQDRYIEKSLHVSDLTFVRSH